MEEIRNITDWVIKIKEGDVKSASTSHNREHSIRCTVSNNNKSRFFDRGIYVHVHFCWRLAVVTLVCESRKDYDNNKNTEHAKDWQNKIPRDLRK